ncbi:MAG: Abi family protein [Propionibacteriaceae bacterium]|jgi:abortive infection bacteriophage resistance protein|nr:Abi family protein [Propionibacteriaceae bacterium]
MKYAKPHLNYEDQVALIKSRGMDVGDERDAVAALKRIGYYRLSAYTYPFRMSGKPDKARQSAIVPRSDEFKLGSTLVDSVKLHDFDHRIRRTILSGIQLLEVGLRAKIAYQLGKKGSMAHLDESNLCLQGLDPHTYAEWRGQYDKLQSKAATEEFVKHFLIKYDGDIPIWAAVQFMTMGCLVALYRMLKPNDARRVAAELGVKNRDVLYGWLRALNVLRNHCAHNSRIWNRSTIYPPDKLNLNLVDDELAHLIGTDRNKLYFLAAVLAYLNRKIDPQTRWPDEFRTAIRKFPFIQGMSPENMMGFPEGWASEPLWCA